MDLAGHACPLRELNQPAKSLAFQVGVKTSRTPTSPPPAAPRLSLLRRACCAVGACGPQAKSWRGFLPPLAPTALPSAQGEESLRPAPIFHTVRRSPRPTDLGTN